MTLWSSSIPSIRFPASWDILGMSPSRPKCKSSEKLSLSEELHAELMNRRASSSDLSGMLPGCSCPQWNGGFENWSWKLTSECSHVALMILSHPFHIYFLVAPGFGTSRVPGATPEKGGFAHQLEPNGFFLRSTRWKATDLAKVQWPCGKLLWNKKQYISVQLFAEKLCIWWPAIAWSSGIISIDFVLWFWWYAIEQILWDLQASRPLPPKHVAKSRIIRILLSFSDTQYLRTPLFTLLTHTGETRQRNSSEESSYPERLAFHPFLSSKSTLTTIHLLKVIHSSEHSQLHWTLVWWHLDQSFP